MPEFPGSITNKQADVIVANLFRWFVSLDRATDNQDSYARSQVAAAICDMVSADITLQPLHDAYGRITRRASTVRLSCGCTVWADVTRHVCQNPAKGGR